VAGGFQQALPGAGLALHYYPALRAANTVSGACTIGIVGTGDHVNTGFRIDADGEILGLSALTGHVEDLLGVCQKAAHRELIGALRADFREFSRSGGVPTGDDASFPFKAQFADGSGGKREKPAAIGGKAEPAGRQNPQEVTVSK
jgi:hypothetical protein